MMKFLMSFFFMIFVLFFEFWWIYMSLMFILFFMFFQSFWFMEFFSMLSYSMGGDMLSMSMVFLSVWIVVLMILASFSVYNSNMSVLEFMGVILFLLIFLVFSFISTDFFMFYLFFESSLIPVLFLIFGWGYQPERLMAGIYLLFYTLFASLPLLMAIFMISESSMTLCYFLIDFKMNIYLYLFMISAFLVKMPMAFVHFWLPKAHVEAPIAGSMILAGIMLKLGGYGLLRSLLFIFDMCLSWNLMIICVSIFGSMMSAILCLYQSDLSSLIAYSSVVHMGMVLGGILIMNFFGFYGSLIMMIGHGLCSSGLFCLANVVYERTMSRSFFVNKGLMVCCPSFCLFWFILIAGNMAAPLSLNLLGELMLMMSFVKWSVVMMFFLGLLSFFSCCYGIYLYSGVQHGSLYGGISYFNLCNVREYSLIFFHLFPLNLIFLKSDIFIIWL